VRAEDLSPVADHDAVVVGSAVSAAHWLDAVKKLVTTHTGTLRARPVWLFPSGPVGDLPKPTEDPVDAAELIHSSGAERTGLRLAKRGTEPA
jgi:menaquinone-dependent protoporphyrinogen oxidase